MTKYPVDNGKSNYLIFKINMKIMMQKTVGVQTY